jgi:hypothetical protein
VLLRLLPLARAPVELAKAEVAGRRRPLQVPSKPR